METEDQGDLSGETFDNLFVFDLGQVKNGDLILFVQPMVPYVNDGFRDMTMVKTTFALQFFPDLDQMRELFN